MTTEEMKLKALRMAWRAAKTDEEREYIQKRAEVIKNPATPKELENIEKGVAEMMKLPDYSHPYWGKVK